MPPLTDKIPRRLSIGLFLFLLVIYSYFWHKPNWNDLGRYDLIMAVVEKGTLCIDAYHQNTGDKAFINGHYYSDKAPGPALLGVPLYAGISWLQSIMGWGPSTLSWFIKLVIIKILLIGVVSSLFGVLLLYYLVSLGLSLRRAFVLILGYSLGTIVFPYSTLFYGHQFAGACLMTGFLLLQKNNQDGRKKYLLLLLSGFLAGYAVFSEYPVILLAVLLTGYVFWKEKNLKSLGWFILGASVPALLLLIYNYQMAGNPFKIGYLSEAGEEFRREMNKGVAGVTYPKLSALWGITFSFYRGLFLLNPFLLLGVPGFYYMYKEGADLRKEWGFCLSAILIFLLFNASYYMWWGGWSLGPRHLVPVLPCLIIPMAFLPPKWDKLLYPLIGISILFMWLGTSVDPQIPDSESNPLFGYALSMLFQDRISANPGVLLGLGFSGGAYLAALIIALGIALLYVTVSSDRK